MKLEGDIWDGVAASGTDASRSPTVTRTHPHTTEPTIGLAEELKSPPITVTGTAADMSMKMGLTIVLFIFASAVQIWSKAIIVDTASGRLLGIQADGGARSLRILLSKLTFCTSGILQRHCKSLR